MLRKLKNSCEIIETLKGELKHYKDIEATLNRAILVAEESTSNIKKAAYDESKVILEDAKRSSATSTKCRCSKAKVLEIEDIYTRKKINYVCSNLPIAV